MAYHQSSNDIKSVTAEALYNLLSVSKVFIGMMLGSILTF